MSKWDYYERLLAKRQEQERYRQLRFVTGNPREIEGNFTSSDALGLSTHPYIKKKSIKYILDWGTGSTGARLITDHLDCHTRVEHQLAKLTGYESATLFHTGSGLNATLLNLLTDSRAIIYLDRGAHHTLVKGAYSTKAKIVRYDHNDIAHLRQLLDEHKTVSKSTQWIVSETVFSSHGDLAYLKPFSKLSTEFDAFLYVDDSMGFGSLGGHGLGFASGKKEIDCVVGNIGKILGTPGAYLLSSEKLKEYITRFSPDLSASMPLPPAILGAFEAMLDLIPDMHAERTYLTTISQQARRHLTEAEFNLNGGCSHIIVLHFDSEDEGSGLYNHLSAQGVQTTLLRPPAVPEGKSRIKLTLNIAHTKDDIARLVKLASTWKRPLICQTL